ncbi:alpha/beta fold hydrolase [Virgibacillus senegalensis]|uniref:alpha/beta fold hydrolase n=1 Tax=Virgibacillus senegalensis TaxID=1499679 RepID=UPI000A4C03AC|nr:alpha/beta hydrolase [Virgibacillus senegalensis]
MEQLIKLNGHHVNVNIVGEGEAIVFLHGGPGSEHRFFLPFVLPLSHKYKLIFYDQRGCGKSEPHGNKPYSMAEEVNTLELLRSELKLEKMNLFGESWGSMLALLYATTYPDRVNKIFLTAAIGISSKGYKVFAKELLKKMSVKDKVKYFWVSRKTKKGTASAEDILAILDPYYVYSKTTLKEKRSTSFNQQANQMIGKDIKNNYDLTDKVDKLANIPIKVAQGSDDMLPPYKIQELLLNDIPHAELHEIQDCGHWTVVEKPEEINFLADKFFENRMGMEKDFKL